MIDLHMYKPYGKSYHRISDVGEALQKEKKEKEKGIQMTT